MEKERKGQCDNNSNKKMLLCTVWWECMKLL